MPAIIAISLNLYELNYTIVCKSTAFLMALLIASRNKELLGYAILNVLFLASCSWPSLHDCNNCCINVQQISKKTFSLNQGACDVMNEHAKSLVN